MTVGAGSPWVCVTLPGGKKCLGHVSPPLQPLRPPAAHPALASESEGAWARLLAQGSVWALEEGALPSEPPSLQGLSSSKSSTQAPWSKTKPTSPSASTEGLGQGWLSPPFLIHPLAWRCCLVGRVSLSSWPGGRSLMAGCTSLPSAAYHSLDWQLLPECVL